MAEPKGKVEGTHSAHSVTLYALSTCIWCRKTRQYLEDQKVAFDFVYVDLLQGDEREVVKEERRMRTDNQPFGKLMEEVLTAAPKDTDSENTVDAAREKHVPAVEKVEGGFKVKVGSVAHPMEAGHYIEWIELVADGIVYRRALQPGQEPVAEFCISADKVEAREYCNLHGLWQSAS